MYRFIKQDNKEQFNRFSLENGGAVYQTTYWAEVKSAWKPTFYMGFDGDKPVLAAAMLLRDVKVGRIWYCPDGFVCDYKNETLMGEFSAFLKSEMKKCRVCAVITDPLIIEKKNNVAQDMPLLDIFKKVGYTVNKNKSFYIVQPACAIAVNLKGETPETLLPKCDKGVRHGLKAAADGGLFVETYDDKSLEAHPEKMDDFFDVMTETTDRLAVIQREKQYYKKIITALNGHAVMDLVYFDNNKHRDDTVRYREKIEELEGKIGQEKDRLASRLLKKERDGIKTVLERKLKIDEELAGCFPDGVPDRICIGASITARFGKNALCFYGGTKNILRNTLRPTHYMNWFRILRSFEQGIELHDLGRVTGDPFDETNPMIGLCNYKRSYNGDVNEYVGDLYLVSDPVRFAAFRYLLPAYKAVKNKLLKPFIKSKTMRNSRGSGV